MDRVSIDDFKKLDIRIARIRTADRIEGSERLVTLEIEIGEETRTLVAGIGAAYDPTSLPGKEIVVVVNLEPRTLMGVESEGMLLAADDGGPVLLCPDRGVTPGSKVR